MNAIKRRGKETQCQDSSNTSSTASESGSEEGFVLSSQRKTKKPVPTAQLEIEGVKVEFLIDTGASVNVLTAEHYKEICAQSGTSIPLQKTSTKIYAFGSTVPVPIQGKFETVVESKKRFSATTFYVAKNPSGTTSLLSCETSADLRLITLWLNAVSKPQASSQAPTEKAKPTDQRLDVDGTKIETVLRQTYPSVFEGIGMLKEHEQKLHIDRDVPPVVQTYRRVPFHLRKQLDAWLDDYLEKDIIEPVVDESTDWVSGLVVAPKPRNPTEVRVCGDYRQVNLAIKRERHPIPTVDELLEDLTGAVKYSKMDLRAGYHQIPLEKDSRAITTFTTHRGLFRYKRLPFGIKSASEVFQNAIENAIRGIEGVRNIADDIILWGATQREHDQRLQQLMERLQSKGLTVNPNKCLFNQESLWFYGFYLTAEGFKADPGKIEAIKHTPPPEDVKQLRSFLGLANYCARFIQDFSTITAPLRALTVKSTPYEWTTAHQNAFDRIKQEIQKDCTMSYYDPKQRTILTVDASPVGLGAILSNVDTDGNIRNVSFASRSLTPVEQRYSQTEREALAVVWGC